jgi:hypothetical protein
MFHAITSPPSFGQSAGDGSPSAQPGCRYGRSGSPFRAGHGSEPLAIALPSLMTFLPLNRNMRRVYN